MNQPDLDPAKIQAAFNATTEALNSFTVALQEARSAVAYFEKAMSGADWDKLRTVGKRRIVRRKSLD